MNTRPIRTKRRVTTQENLPAILERAIKGHSGACVILQKAGVSRERILKLLARIHVTFHVPFADDFLLPIGKTRKTFQRLIDRIDDLAREIERLHNDPTYAPARLCDHLSDQGKKLVGPIPLEKYFSVLPTLLRLHAMALKTRKRMVGHIRMGPGRGHLPRNNFLKRLFEEIKQPLKASDYRAIGELLDALAPDHQSAFEESRLRRLHKTTLKRAIQ